MHLICVTYIWRLIFQGKDLDIWPPFSLFFLKKPKQQQQQSLAPISIFRYLKLDCKEEQRNRNWCGLPEPATASFFCSHAVYIYDMQEQDDWKACLWVYLCMFALNYNAQEKRSCIALSAEKMLSWVLHWSCFFRNKIWMVFIASAWNPCSQVLTIATVPHFVPVTFSLLSFAHLTS